MASNEGVAAPLINGEPLSTRNVSKLTTFEIRQELNRRGKMDLPEEVITHKTLLQRLIAELVSDEASVAQQAISVADKKNQDEREAARLLREQKKAEALARSEARRAANPNYFAEKQQLNVKPVRQEGAAGGEEAEGQGQGEGGGKGDDEDEQEIKNDNDEEDNPFRTYKSKARPKIYVR